MITTILVLPLALASYGAGYIANSVAKASRALRRVMRLDWLRIAHGPIMLKAPANWGQLEPAADGMLVLHNLPKRLRVDGDAVWYGTAIEIRIYQCPVPRKIVNDAARSFTKRLGSRKVPIIAELILANGVRPAKEREALRVYRSLHIKGDPAAIDWPPEAEPNSTLRRFLPPHSSRIARDFEDF